VSPHGVVGQFKLFGQLSDGLRRSAHQGDDSAPRGFEEALVQFCPHNHRIMAPFDNKHNKSRIPLTYCTYDVFFLQKEIAPGEIPNLWQWEI
jgi:hypothetical protein